MPSVTGGDQVIEAGTIKKEKVNIDFCVWKNRRQVLASLHLLLLPWYICWAMNLFEFVLLRPPSCNATLSTEHRLTLKSLLERLWNPYSRDNIVSPILQTKYYMFSFIFDSRKFFYNQRHCEHMSCFHQNWPPENRWHFWDTPGRNLKT